MLNKVNLDAKLKKSDLKKLLDEKLGYELGKAQRAARDAGMPVIMVLRSRRGSSLSLPRFGNDFRLRGISLFTVTAGTT